MRPPIALVVLLLATHVAAQTPFEAALALEDPDDRLDAIRHAAELGDPAARHALASAIASENPVASAKWLALAAGPLRSAEQYTLGVRYLNGDGLSQDSERAALWLAEAARQGHAGAQVLLAGLLDRGDGITSDTRAADRLLEQAARRGSLEAQFRLSQRLGLPRGERWLRSAAAGGHADALRTLAVAQAQGGDLPLDEAASRQLLHQAAERGDPTSMLLLGFFLADGRGGPEAPEQAWYWLRRAEIDGESRGRDRRAALERSLDGVALMEQEIAVRGDVVPPILAPVAGDRVVPATRKLGAATGFRLGDDSGLVITNAHVIESCGELRLPDATVLRPLAVVDHVDLAVLAGASASGPGLGLATAEPARGTAVTVLSHEQEVVSGAVTALERPGGDGRFFRFDARLEQGASGGPVVDRASGKVVGVTAAKMTPGAAFRLTGNAGEPAVFAVKAPVLAAFLDVHGIAVPERASGSIESAGTAIECWF
ncbi:MAG: tetratricopeptide repeat-containing serine protease family protein [Pseudomonadota bacterium]